MTLEFLSLIGVFVFAVSGGLLAARKNLDIFGFVVLAFMPACAGGTLRDLLLDVPVFWLSEPINLWLTLAAAIVCFVGHRWLGRVMPVLVWFDAVGLSVFAALGTAKTLDLGFPPIIAVFMGVVTAVAGGLVRDVIANEVPLVLEREVYALAAVVGSVAVVLSIGIAPAWAVWIGTAACLLVRACAISLHWSLPRAERPPPPK